MQPLKPLQFCASLRANRPVREKGCNARKFKFIMPALFPASPI